MYIVHTVINIQIIYGLPIIAFSAFFSRNLFANRCASFLSRIRRKIAWESFGKGNGCGEPGMKISSSFFASPITGISKFISLSTLTAVETCPLPPSITRRSGFELSETSGLFWAVSYIIGLQRGHIILSLFCMLPGDEWM